MKKSIARTGRLVRPALALALALAFTPFGSAQAATGHLKSWEYAAMPQSTAIEVRAHALRQRNFVVEAVLIDALQRQGYRIEIGAPHVVRYQAAGTFSRLTGDSSWLRLYGSTGSSSRGTGHLTLRLPDFGQEPVRPNKYQISLTLEDQPGTKLWEAVAIYETDESDVAVVARTMVTATLDRWGQSYDGPLER